jgi:xanthine dehydrogenase accessory factor
MNIASRESPNLISNALCEVLEGGAAAVLVTLINAPDVESNDLKVGSKIIIKESGERIGSLGNVALEEAIARHADAFLRGRDQAGLLNIEEFAPEILSLRGISVLFERIEPEPRLVICGAGHVGAALARLAALVGYRVTLIDDRSEFVNRESFAAQSEQHIEPVLANDWSEAVRAAIGNGRGVSVAIVTRGHKQDEDCLRATIEAYPDYVGMIGSKRRTNIVLDKLRTEGAPEAELNKVRAPIGLDIGSVSPEEVALAILAEIVAERRGGAGAPLSWWRRG